MDDAAGLRRGLGLDLMRACDRWRGGARDAGLCERNGVWRSVMVMAEKSSLVCGFVKHPVDLWL
jgi:hypothetical protein